MSIAFDACCFTVPLMMPLAVELSVCRGPGCRLAVAHFGESCSQYGDFFCVEEKGADFGFGG
jgi:hypothetical protein